jgi:hypothetical protein
MICVGVVTFEVLTAVTYCPLIAGWLSDYGKRMPETAEWTALYVSYDMRKVRALVSSIPQCNRRNSFCHCVVSCHLLIGKETRRIYLAMFFQKHLSYNCYTQLKSQPGREVFWLRFSLVLHGEFQNSSFKWATTVSSLSNSPFIIMLTFYLMPNNFCLQYNVINNLCINHNRFGTESVCTIFQLVYQSKIRDVLFTK